MNYTILEDCSPYYIRYKHEGSDDIIRRVATYKKNLCAKIDSKQPFIHFKLPINLGQKEINSVYCGSQLKLNPERASLFITQPGFYYRPHKDGLQVRSGINYNIDIRDDKCVTSWYSDESLSHYEIDTVGGRSREIMEHSRETIKNNIQPVKSMIAQQNDVILFNTDIFHDFDNSQSTNERTILTLRSTLYNRLDYFAARKILFGF